MVTLIKENVPAIITQFCITEPPDVVKYRANGVYTHDIDSFVAFNPRDGG